MGDSVITQGAVEVPQPAHSSDEDDDMNGAAGNVMHPLEDAECADAPFNHARRHDTGAASASAASSFPQGTEVDDIRIESTRAQGASAGVVNRYRVRVRAYGEPFDPGAGGHADPARRDVNKHTQGTEIKAITMHEMKIRIDKSPVEVYVLVDI